MRVLCNIIIIVWKFGREQLRNWFDTQRLSKSSLQILILQRTVWSSILIVQSTASLQNSTHYELDELDDGEHGGPQKQTQDSTDITWGFEFDAPDFARRLI